MTPTNGTLDGLIEEMERLLVQAEANLYQRDQEREKAAEEVKRLRAILRAAGVTQEEAKPLPVDKRPVRVNEETREKVLAAIRHHESLGRRAIPDVRGSFTVKDITGDFHEGSARTAISMLREEGVVRAVGPVPNSKRVAPMAYALMPVVEEDEPRVG